MVSKFTIKNYITLRSATVFIRVNVHFQVKDIGIETGDFTIRITYCRR